MNITEATRRDGQILGSEPYLPKLPLRLTAYFFVGVAGLIGIWGVLSLFSTCLTFLEWPEKLLENKNYLGVILEWPAEILLKPFFAVGILTSIPIMGVGGFFWLLFQKYLGEGMIYQIICPMCKSRDEVDVYNKNQHGDLPVTDVCSHCGKHFLIQNGEIYHTTDCD